MRFFLLLLLLSAHAQAHTVLVEAEKLAYSGNHAQAAELYEKFYDSQEPIKNKAAFFYNWAALLFKTNHVAHAYGVIQAAKRFAIFPGTWDAEVKTIRQQLGAPILMARPQTPPLARWSEGWGQISEIKFEFWLILGFLCALGAVRAGKHKRLTAVIGLGTGSIVLLLIALSAFLRDQSPIAVTKVEAQTKSGPAEQNPTMVDIPAGSSAYILGEREDWLQIAFELSGQSQISWIKKTEVFVIPPRH